MTADIEAIRARIAAATPEEAGLIAHVPADLAALCDEVEALREKLGRRRLHALYRATKCGRITGRSEMDAYGRALGHALVKEIQERRKSAETSDDLAQGWYETEVDLHDALDREAELTVDLYELRQQRREAAEQKRAQDNVIDRIGGTLNYVRSLLRSTVKNSGKASIVVARLENMLPDTTVVDDDD